MPSRCQSRAGFYGRVGHGPSELGSHLALDGLARVSSMTTWVSGGSKRV